MQQQGPQQPLQGQLVPVYARVLDPHVDQHANRTYLTETYRTHPFKIISFMQNKGGVGKTICSWSVACGLAKAGRRVLFVDADGQRNGEETAMSRQLYEYFGGDSAAFYQQFQCADTLLTALQ